MVYSVSVILSNGPIIYFLSVYLSHPFSLLPASVPRPLDVHPGTDRGHLPPVVRLCPGSVGGTEIHGRHMLVDIPIGMLGVIRRIAHERDGGLESCK